MFQASACACSCAPSEYKTYSRKLFNSDIMLYVELLGGNADGVYAAMSEECDRLFAAIDPLSAKSSVYKFNHTLGERVDGRENVLGGIDYRYKIEVDRYCYEMVSASIGYYNSTSSAFSITVKRLTELWGVDAKGIADAEQGKLIESFPTRQQLLEQTNGVQSPNLIEPLTENGKYYLIKDANEIEIDLGGIAKGYLADRLAMIAESYGIRSALIDVGGTLRLLGGKLKENKKQEWSVGVRQPAKGSTDYICALKLPESCAVSTSGSYERGYDKDGYYVCHIIDPTTGLPITLCDTFGGDFANNLAHVVSATVWGDNAALCDVMSTSACIKGEQSAATLKAYGLSAVMFTSNGVMYTIGDVEFLNGYDGYLGYERVAL